MPVVSLLAAAAAFAEPPPRALLDDLDRWERGQDALLDGPPGCWDLRGDVRQVVTLHQPPDRFGAPRREVLPMVGTVEGRLVDGVWQHELVRELRPEGHPHELDVPIHPLFGSKKKASGAAESSLTVSVGGDQGAQISGSIGQSVNLLRQAVEEWSGSTESALAQWDEAQQAVLYLREVPVREGDARPIAVTVRFPGGGERADRIDAVWPELIRYGSWPVRVAIRDAQMHALGHEVGGRVFPWAEKVSLVGGALGFTFGFEQSITWRAATPCAAPAETPP